MNENRGKLPATLEPPRNQNSGYPEAFAIALLVAGMQYAHGGHMLEEPRYIIGNVWNQMDNDDEEGRYVRLNSTQAGMKSDQKSARGLTTWMCAWARIDLHAGEAAFIGAKFLSRRNGTCALRMGTFCLGHSVLLEGRSVRSYRSGVSRPPLVMYCRGGGHPLTFVRNAHKSYPAITAEMLRRNNVGPVHAGDPNTFRRGFIES